MHSDPNAFGISRIVIRFRSSSFLLGASGCLKIKFALARDLFEEMR